MTQKYYLTLFQLLVLDPLYRCTDLENDTPVAFLYTVHTPILHCAKKSD